MVICIDNLKSSTSTLTDTAITACLSSAAKLARRQRGEKKCSPRESGRKLEHRAAWSQRGGFLSAL